MKAETQLVRIPALEIPLRDSVALIPEAPVPADNFLIDAAETASDALDDGLTFIDPKVLSEDFLLAEDKVENDALDDGLAFPKVEIVDAISIVGAQNGDGFLHPSKVLSLRDGLVFAAVEREDVLKYLLPFSKPTIMEFVNFLKVPEIIPPFSMMPRPDTWGGAFGSRPDWDEPVRPQSPPQNLGKMGRKCRHGDIRSECPICRFAPPPAPINGKPTNGYPQVVDLLKLLEIILQPPILPADGRPIIFPNGNKPFPFQIGGVKWLVERKSALLADEMGLGKTIQAIIAIRILFRRGELQRTLVVCPASVTYNWEREIRSWAPELRVFRLSGDRAMRSEAWKSHAEIYVVSYETLRNDIHGIDPAKFDLCVLDEAQRIKNPDTRIHRAVKRLTPQYRWALTGTPLENSIDDVVALFSFLKPGLFSDDYIWFTHVNRMIKPYILRRTIEEISYQFEEGYPEITRQEHWLELLPHQLMAYQTLEFRGIEALKQMGVDATRVHVFALINKLKQLCNYDESSGESSKLDFLKEMLDNLSASGEKALIFSQYPQKTLKVIEPKLLKYKPLAYHGSMSGNKRNAVIQNFERDDRHGILLMSLRKCLKTCIGSSRIADKGALKVVFHEQREIPKRPNGQRMGTAGTDVALPQSRRPADQVPASGGDERYPLCVAHRVRMADAPSRPAPVAHYVPLLPHVA